MNKQMFSILISICIFIQCTGVTYFINNSFQMYIGKINSFVLYNERQTISLCTCSRCNFDCVVGKAPSSITVMVIFPHPSHVPAKEHRG